MIIWPAGKDYFRHFIHLSGVFLAGVSSVSLFLMLGNLIREITWMMKQGTPDATALSRDFSLQSILPVVMMIFFTLFWFRKIRRNMWLVAVGCLLVLDFPCGSGLISYLTHPAAFWHSAYWPAPIPGAIILLRLLTFPVCLALMLGVERLLAGSKPLDASGR